jgi:hypothetical protein
VNGDGINDYLYSAQGRDERTDALDDRTGKTYLYFGGPPTQEEDQFLYAELRPAGDLNDDGLDDALRLDSSSVVIYEGTQTGYQNSGVSFQTSGGQQVRGFTDLDGDGVDDVVVASASEDRFSVVYGGTSLSAATVQTYQPGSTRPPFQHNVSDLDGNGSSSVVRLAGESDPGTDTIRVSILDISSARTLTTDQSFAAEELDRRADLNQLSLVNLDGIGAREIVATTGFDASSYYFAASAGSYDSTPDSLGKDDAVPVGDLDDDGRHDFYTFDEETDTRYVSFGPGDLGTDLTFDTEIPYPPSAFGTPAYVPQGSLGDVTGDGRPDAVLDFTNPRTEVAGRRFFSVDANRTAQPPSTVTYPEGTFFDGIPTLANVGDVNGDGTPDFALVRFGTNEVEVFFGGLSIDDRPDLTLEAPVDSTFYLDVTGGDFNGDGASDIAVSYNQGVQVDVYLGGDDLDATIDHVLDPADFGLEAIYSAHFIGDVNDDGVDDLFVTDLGFFPEAQSSAENFAVFFGGSPLPTVPDQTVGYPTEAGAGRSIAAPGDLNGDGVDDFVVGRPSFDDGSNATGRADVYFGSPNPSFDSPDLVIRPPDLSASVLEFSSLLTGGDFTGDGAADLAIASTSSDRGISLFEGGDAFDDARDQSLPVPAGSRVGLNLDADSLSERLRGVLAGAGDANGDGTEDLLLASGFGQTNALLYSPSTQTDPIRVLRAPNQDASLSVRGGFTVAAGDFLANGISDLVLSQYFDNNDAATSSRVYRYALDLDAPTADVPTDPLTDTLTLGETSTRSVPIENTAGANAEALGFAVTPVSREPSARRSSKAHVPAPSIAIEYDGSVGDSSTATGAIGWTSPQDGYDWYCAEGTAGQQITLTAERTSGDILPNLGIGPGTVSNGAPVGALPDGLAQTTSNGSDPSVSLTYTPSTDGPVTISVSTWTESQDGGNYSLTVSGAQASSSCKTGIEWLTVAPSTGTVEPGQDQSVEVTFSARSNAPGTYDGALRIATNDPEQDTVTVPTSLTITPPPISISSPDAPLTPGTGAPVDLTFPTAFTPTSGSLFYRGAGTTPFASTPLPTSDLTVDTASTVTVQLPDSVVTTTGVQAYVQASGPLPDGSGTIEITAPGAAPTRTAFLPADLGTVEAAGAFRPQAYRMITVPLDLGDRSVFDVLKNQYGPPSPSDWRLARWADSSYAFGANVDSLRPGEAAWLITRTGDSLTVSDARSAPAGGPQPITLPPNNWTQIGSPFAFPVAWSDVQAPSAVTRPQAFDTSASQGNRFIEVDSLRPWRGAFVYSTADSAVTIEVPPTGRDSAGSDTAAGPSSVPARAKAAGGYRLTARPVAYRSGDRLTGPAARLGFFEEAAAGFGPADRAQPPAIGPHVRLSAVPEEGPALARSLKPPSSEGAAWTLELRLQTGEPLASAREVGVALSEEGSRPPGFQRYVVDLGREKRLPVTNGSVTARLTPERPVARLRVIVGTEAFARQNSGGAALAITETKLRANAPNPFAEQTTISYQLAEAEEVTLRVYDVLGRRVRTLVDGERERGVHQVEWRPGSGGQALASGVYFCRMRAGSYTETRKLVVVR